MTISEFYRIITAETMMDLNEQTLKAETTFACKTRNRICKL